LGFKLVLLPEDGVLLPKRVGEETVIILLSSSSSSSSLALQPSAGYGLLVLEVS
jgi:hypothetical protein